MYMFVCLSEHLYEQSVSNSLTIVQLLSHFRVMMYPT